MEKALVLLSDNNKGKFVAKGFSSAFRDLHFFVYDKKIYDLNIDEVKKFHQILFLFFGLI